MAALLGLALASWQLDRKAIKEDLIKAFDQAPELELGLGPGSAQDPGRAISSAAARGIRFARISVAGEMDTRSFLLDNQVHKSRAGVQVVTPLHLAGGDVLLVMRGWLPLAADRRSLPEFATPAGTVMLEGILNLAPQAGIQLGEPDALGGEEWPKLITYLELGDISARLGKDVVPRVLQLDSGNPHGFQGRQWQAGAMTPARHGAYALQWLGLALCSLVGWLALGLRRGHEDQVRPA